MNKSAPQSKPLSLRLSPAQRRELERRAGKQPLSIYIRAQLFAANDNAPVSGKQDLVNNRQALAQILAKLGQNGIASNLKELADAARSGSLVLDEESNAALLKASADIAEIKALLMQSLGIKER
ncbi:MAG: hypothetical protein AAFR90_12030 [Pseudomonadota bacterium]